MKFHFVGCLCFLLLMACGDKASQAGKGGIWDETENGVALRVRDESGKPVARAKVTWVHMGDWMQARSQGAAPHLDSGWTDQNGDLRIDSVSGSLVLSVLHDSLVASALVSKGAETAECVLAKPSRVLGRLAGESALPDSLYLAGTRHASAVGNDGFFQFDAVAPGAYGLVGFDEQGVRLVSRADVSEETADSRESYTWSAGDSVLLDDFEDDISANRFHALSGTGWWYTYSDPGSWFEPVQASDAYVQGDLAWQGGRSLRMKMLVQGTPGEKFALCGFDLENTALLDSTSPAVLHDLTALDSVSFWARGQGTMSLQLVSAVSVLESVSAPFVLTEMWTRHVVAVQAFDSERWNLMAGRITAVNFIAQESAELWLDQVYLHGLVETDLFDFTQGREP